jgi:hypothetical protein
MLDLDALRNRHTIAERTYRGLWFQNDLADLIAEVERLRALERRAERLVAALERLAEIDVSDWNLEEVAHFARRALAEWERES